MNAPPRPGDVLTRELNGKPRPICHGFSRLRGGKRGKKKKKQNKCKHPSAFLLCAGDKGGQQLFLSCHREAACSPPRIPGIQIPPRVSIAGIRSTNILVKNGELKK